MHRPHCNSLSQLVCGYGISWGASGWPLFDRIKERSSFTCLLSHVFAFFAHVCYKYFLHHPVIFFLKLQTGLLIVSTTNPKSIILDPYQPPF